MAVILDDEQFQYVLRVCNTTVEGKRSIMYALTSIKGLGRRYANLLCKNAGVDPLQRAGSLTAEQRAALDDVIENPENYKIPQWFKNRLRDYKTGKSSHEVASGLEMQLRENFERLKKIKCNRGLRHHWRLKVRGQHTKSTGRRGKTLGVSRKK